jgi:hypothetical protein
MERGIFLESTERFSVKNLNRFDFSRTFDSQKSHLIRNPSDLGPESPLIISLPSNNLQWDRGSWDRGIVLSTRT